MKQLFEFTVETGPNPLKRKAFQTPPAICRYMASLIPLGTRKVLEPTPGEGGIVSFLKDYEVTAPEDFFLMPQQRFDCVIMNPPFSSKYAYMENAPTALQGAGMQVGYYILTQCLKMANSVIALMPWFTISDSDARLRKLKKFGLKSLTALPRKTFRYARIQTCVLELQKGFGGETAFKVFELLRFWKQAELFEAQKKSIS